MITHRLLINVIDYIDYSSFIMLQNYYTDYELPLNLIQPNLKQHAKPVFLLSHTLTLLTLFMQFSSALVEVGVWPKVDL